MEDSRPVSGMPSQRLFVDGAELLEKFAVSRNHFGTQSGIVLAYERAIMRFRRVIHLDIERIAHPDSLFLSLIHI